MSADLLAVDEARARVVAAVAAPLEPEAVALGDALGRVLAEDVEADHDVPGFDNSAMDGYAVRAGPAGRALRIVDESRAGAPAKRAVGEDEAVRIATGAPVPGGATSVVPVERVTEGDGEVTSEVEARPGANIRRAGEDVSAGATVLLRGAELGPAELGMAVAAGRAEVRCARRPRVWLLATGDELAPPGAALGPGQIHNTNAITLAGLARRAGADVEGVDTVPDERAGTEAALRAALEAADVVCISGGVSVGPHDHVKPALAALRVQEHFWRVAMKPGKPAWFGVRDSQLVFGLPGNPVSAAVCFQIFARPALRALQGSEPLPARERAELADEVALSPGREQVVRVSLDSSDGVPRVRPTGPQGSHLLSSLVGADALAFVPAGEGALPAGELVPIERL